MNLLNRCQPSDRNCSVYEGRFPDVRVAGKLGKPESIDRLYPLRARRVRLPALLTAGMVWRQSGQYQITHRLEIAPRNRSVDKST